MGLFTTIFKPKSEDEGNVVPTPSAPAAAPAPAPAPAQAPHLPDDMVANPPLHDAPSSDDFSVTGHGEYSLPADFDYKLPDTPVDDIGSASVLVVDDDPELLSYLNEELQDLAGEIHLASNGEKAIEALRKYKIDIVVSDVMMPKMDGFTFCLFVKTSVEFSHIPVILLTARADEKSRLLGYKNGADEYLTKPFEIDDLRDIINKSFQRRWLIRQRFVQQGPMPAASESTFSSADEKFLQKFNQVVADNITNPDLDIQLLVREMKMSRTMMYNKLTLLTGLNLKEYINKMRMEHVIELIKTSDYSFAEIAEKSGFNSPRYFSTAFKNYTGMTPSQYKKEHA